MKTIITTALLCISYSFMIGQPLKANGQKSLIEKFKKEPCVIALGYDKEFDEAVKFAFDKYWKFSPVKYITSPDKYPTVHTEKQGNVVFMRETEELWSAKQTPKITSTILKLYGNNTIRFDSYFDDYKNEDKSFGIDQSFHMKAIKVIPYIMCLAAEMNRLEEWGVMKYTFHKGLKEKVKNYTVIIPKENITNKRFSEDFFKPYFTKYEFLDSEEINKKIRDQKNTENVALLCIGRSLSVIQLSIIDIKTGDLLYVDNGDIGKGSKSKDFEEEDIKKVLKNLEKWNKKQASEGAK